MELYILKKNTFLYLLIALLFTACQKEVQIDIPQHESQLVIEGRIETGLPPIILMGTSKDIFSDNSLDSIFGSYISNAVITITDGTNIDTLETICTDDIPKGYEDIGAALFGIPATLVSKFHLCAYSTLNTQFFGQEGKNYSITIFYKGKKYTSSTSIPQSVLLDTVYWKPEKSTPNHGLAYAKLTDPIINGNAYFWEVLRIKQGTDGSNLDKRFYKPRNPVFNDEFINGIQFDFWYENPRSYYDESLPDAYRGLYQRGDTVLIKFSSINNTVFNFLQKKYTQINSGGSPFSTPINIPSNISGGAFGLFGGYATTYQTLICEDY